MFAATERRIAAEWALLEQLAAANPGRLTALRRSPAEFQATLHGPIALSIPKQQQGERLSVHPLRVEFPVHFPAVPMELYLCVPVFHPNVHPETGFVCLWDRHRVSHSVEQAMHKLVAMLGGGLWNGEAPHVMQPGAVSRMGDAEPMPLQGVAYEPIFPRVASVAGPRRRRLL